MPVLKIPLSCDEKLVLDELAANDLRQPVQVMRWLYRTAKGRYFSVTRTQSQRERRNPCMSGYQNTRWNMRRLSHQRKWKMRSPTELRRIQGRWDGRGKRRGNKTPTRPHRTGSTGRLWQVGYIAYPEK